jgi:DNA-binding NtrC family response regulator
MSRGTILVVDDKASMVQLLRRLLSDQHHVIGAHSAEEALAKIEVADVDVVISDIKMPGMDGTELLRAVKARRPQAEVILMTAYATIQSAVDAIRAGAFDYLPKPFEPDDALLKIERALEFKHMRDRANALQDTVDGRFRFDRLVGRGPGMQKVVTLLRKAASLDLTVLLLGETGTGKELAARAIHAASERRAGPFVAVNCGAFPAELLESELYGHAKGSFTGASQDKPGLLDEADGGTLFLDEIGDMPLPLQVKLNRVLQEREYRRVGETRDRTTNARVVAATHVDLAKRVADGKFREDLYYRLKVFPVELPPLRTRPEDIELLAVHFLGVARERLKRPEIRGLHPTAMRALGGYMWPGNVRELQHALERAVAVADGNEVTLEDLPPELTSGRDRIPLGDVASLPYREAIELLTHQATRAYLAALLETVGGNVSKAAEKAGLARESLHRLLRKHGVDADLHRS